MVWSAPPLSAIRLWGGAGVSGAVTIVHLHLGGAGDGDILMRWVLLAKPHRRQHIYYTSTYNRANWSLLIFCVWKKRDYPPEFQCVAVLDLIPINLLLFG